MRHLPDLRVSSLTWRVSAGLFRREREKEGEERRGGSIYNTFDDFEYNNLNRGPIAPWCQYKSRLSPLSSSQLRAIIAAATSFTFSLGWPSNDTTNLDVSPWSAHMSN